MVLFITYVHDVPTAVCRGKERQVRQPKHEDEAAAAAAAAAE